MRHIAIALAVTTTLTATVACDAEPVESADAARLAVTDEDAERILALVNDPGTDLGTLDLDAGLNARAAANIIEVRNGLDDVYPSDDDAVFDSLEDLDAVPYVGSAAIEALRDYVLSNPPPTGELVEGVALTGEQAEAIVWGVNQASVEELDHVVNLDARAAQALVASAPYDSVTEMADVPYVGQFALHTMRSYAPTWGEGLAAERASSQAGTYDGVTFDHETAATALDIANAASESALVGPGGMWRTGAARIVAGRPYDGLSEVAGRTGIGTSTMRSLHDFAASQTWNGE